MNGGRVDGVAPLDVVCPYCEAGVNEPCRNDFGLSTGPHSSRVRATVSLPGKPKEKAPASTRPSSPEAVLREALEEAEHVFRVYAEMHDRKGTAEGRQKARRNEEHADRIRAALAQTEGEG